jgi:hypothetical protein
MDNNIRRPSSNSSQNELLIFVQNKYLKKLFIDKNIDNPLD